MKKAINKFTGMMRFIFDNDPTLLTGTFVILGIVSLVGGAILVIDCTVVLIKSLISLSNELGIDMFYSVLFIVMTITVIFGYFVYKKFEESERK